MDGAANSSKLSGSGSKRRPRGRPWPRGVSGNPGGKRANADLVSSGEAVSLIQAGEEAIRALGGQLRALRLVAETRALEQVERAYLVALVQQVALLEGTRGRLVLEAMKLGDPKAALAALAASMGETPKIEAKTESDKPMTE